ncbi:MAG: hypothetical protein U5R31_08275 [Acidimicrobiia bacterium]|nr:hypothetical protein [Acidimicrobiia bacterium]
MIRNRWLALPVLAGWTLLVWGTRIDNIWSDPDLTTGGQVGRTILAGSFVLAGLAVGAVAVRLRRHRASRSDRFVVGVAAVWTVVVWAVRAISIVLADHGAAFTLVHLALAVVSAAVAWWAWSAVRTGPAPRTRRPRRHPRSSTGWSGRHRRFRRCVSRAATLGSPWASPSPSSPPGRRRPVCSASRPTGC